MTTTVVVPDGTPILGNVSVQWVATIADTAAPKLATEISAAAPASWNVTGSIIAESWEPGQDVSKDSAPRRLSERNAYERFTTTTQQLADLQYVITPQGAAASVGKKVFETLTEGLAGYFVERLGLDARTAWAVGQFVNVIPVTLGPRLITGGTEEANDFMVLQPVGIRGARTQNVAIVT